MHNIVFEDIFRRLPLLKPFAKLIQDQKIVAKNQEHFKRTKEKVDRRMTMGNERDDFFGHLLSDKAINLSPVFLTGQGSTLIVAGSETIATFLTGMFSYPPTESVAIAD